MKKFPGKAVTSLCVLYLFSCTSNEVFNARAKYEGKEYVTLKKVFEINTGVEIFRNTYIQAVYDIDVDDENNVYVMDRKASKVRKFDINGKYVTTFGGAGEGPKELDEAFWISIFDNNMYMVEWYKHSVKIWDMNGNYVGKDRIFPILNSQFIRPFDNYYIGVSNNYDKGEGKFEVIKVFRDTTASEIIMSMDKDRHKFWMYKPIFKYAFISATEYYGTPQIPDQYIIHKYGIAGNVIGTIGRPYERKPFSDKARDFLTERYEKNNRIDNDFSYPPIVREIFLDGKENLWVAVGEHVKDVNWRFSVPTAIDIFNKEGVYLYSFRSSEIGRIAFIKNGRLYSVTGPRGSGDEFDVIHVFDVIYNY